MLNISTREAYGRALEEFGEDERIVVLDADLSKSTRTELFRKKYSERFFNIGIAEQNMISIAAGIASCGKVVFASTFAMFVAGRAFEQIRNSVCYPKLDVKIGASHSGITVGEDGASHQAIEDIALMTAIPDMVVLNPADGVETREAVKAAIGHQGPVYLRLYRLPTPVIFDRNKYDFQLGKGIVVRDGHDVSIVVTGTMLSYAIEAAKVLSDKKINSKVINIHTVKPIDQKLLIQSARETGAVVTVEEHSTMGGLGSIVASVLAMNHPTPVRMVAINDKFGKSGTPADLMEKYGLTVDNIVRNVHLVMQAKL